MTRPPVTRADVLAAGVKSLRDFGYANVTAENLVTDQVYGMVFYKLLMDAMAEVPRDDRGSLRAIADEVVAARTPEAPR